MTRFSERPSTRHWRPASRAALAIETMRPTLEEKVVTATRPLAPLDDALASPSPTATSDGDLPSRSALVESQISASTPLSPRRGNAPRRSCGPIVGCRIDLPVAGVDDGAGRRGDRQRHRLGDRMGDRNGFDLERTDGELLAGPVDRHRDFRRALLALRAWLPAGRRLNGVIQTGAFSFGQMSSSAP